MNDHYSIKKSSSDYDVFEGMTSISAVINSILNGSSDRRIIRVLFDAQRAAQKSRDR
jgi:hypothetical protein